MIEFLMVIPLLAAVLGLTFFFGSAMANQQRLKIATRYQCWSELRKNNSASVSDLNRFHLDDRADESSFDSDWGGGPTEAFHELVSAVAGEATIDEAATVMQAEVIYLFPHGIRYKAQADFPSTMGIRRWLDETMQCEYVCDGVEWRRGDASYEVPIFDVFLGELDEQISTLNDVLYDIGSDDDYSVEREVNRHMESIITILTGSYLERW